VSNKPYEGKVIDFSQGFPEVNWAIMRAAKEAGVGFEVTRRVLFLFGDEPTKEVSDRIPQDNIEEPDTDQLTLL